jgi:hypothetical protein
MDAVTAKVSKVITWVGVRLGLFTAKSVSNITQAITSKTISG